MAATTFAAIRRRAVVGVRLEIIWRAFPPTTLPPRKILKAQSNAIVLEPWPGKDKPSWLYWPTSASDIRIDGPDTFTVCEDGKPMMTYHFV